MCLNAYSYPKDAFFMVQSRYWYSKLLGETSSHQSQLRHQDDILEGTLLCPPAPSGPWGVPGTRPPPDSPGCQRGRAGKGLPCEYENGNDLSSES